MYILTRLLDLRIIHSKLKYVYVAIQEVYEIYEPEGPMHEQSEGATKGLRVYKLHRFHCACV